METFAALRLACKPDAHAQVAWRNAAGHVAPAIAGTPQLDLLVVGTHGRGPLGRVLHGGVASAVAGSAQCPVVAVTCTPVAAVPPEDAASC